jgi:hypothetical protein
LLLLLPFYFLEFFKTNFIEEQLIVNLVLVLALTFYYFLPMKKIQLLYFLLGRKHSYFFGGWSFSFDKKNQHCCLGSEIKIVLIYSSPALLIVPLGSVRASKVLYKDIGCSVPLDRILSLNLVATSLLKIPFLEEFKMSASRTSAHL